jgi:hypothetical protein
MLLLTLMLFYQSMSLGFKYIISHQIEELKHSSLFIKQTFFNQAGHWISQYNSYNLLTYTNDIRLLSPAVLFIEKKQQIHQIKDELACPRKIYNS